MKMHYEDSHYKSRLMKGNGWRQAGALTVRKKTSKNEKGFEGAGPRA